RRSVATIRMQLQAFALVLRKLMASLDSVSIAILLGAVLVMAGILSSLLALRFGAPLLLVFLAIGMLAGDSGPGQLRFDDVRTTYLVGAVVASTDAAAVFLLVHAQGLRLRPRVGATLEAESGTNDPFAVFLTLMLVELISSGQSSAWHVVLEFGREAVLGAIIGVIGG